MAIKDFELFHGAVLTKLVRNDKRDITLRMIETNKESWSTYKVNDIYLLIKHSLNPVHLTRENGTRWQFTFSKEQLRQLREHNAWAALICGGKNFKDLNIEICLLEPEQILNLLDINAEKNCSIIIKQLRGKSLRVSSSRLDGSDIIVGKNKIDTWIVPGS